MGVPKKEEQEKYYTVAEYLEIEALAEERSEYQF